MAWKHRLIGVILVVGAFLVVSSLFSRQEAEPPEWTGGAYCVDAIGGSYCYDASGKLLD